MVFERGSHSVPGRGHVYVSFWVALEGLREKQKEACEYSILILANLMGRGLFMVKPIHRAVSQSPAVCVVCCTSCLSVVDVTNFTGITRAAVFSSS